MNRGITIEYTATGEHQGIGCAESHIRTITEKGRTLLQSAKLPANFWSDDVVTAACLHNLTPNAARTIPWELMYKKKPSIGHLQKFGCGCWYRIPAQQRASKLNEKFHPAVFVGYTGGQDLYQVFDIDKRKKVVMLRLMRPL